MALEMPHTFKAVSSIAYDFLLHFCSFLDSREEAAETPQPVDRYNASIFLGIRSVGKMKEIQKRQMENEDCSQLLSPL